jgi:DNA-binding phage protein
MRILEVKDIVPLLRAEVQRADGLSAWSKKTGVHRTIVSKVLNHLSQPTKTVIKALKLRKVFVVGKDQPKRLTRSR